MVSVVATIVDQLKQLGINKCFSIPGGNCKDMHMACVVDDHIQTITMRQEQSSVFACNAIYKSSGIISSFVLVTSGPGMTNLVTGLQDAKSDSVPLLAIVGDVPKHTLKHEPFQSCDFQEMVKPIVKRFIKITHENYKNTRQLVYDAYMAAMELPRHGPVILHLPLDIGTLLIPSSLFPTHLLTCKYKQETIAPSSKRGLTNIAVAIRKAKKPLFLIGGGCMNSFEELSILIESTGIHFVHSMLGIGATTNDLCLGMAGGFGKKRANDAIGACDVLVVVGARLDPRLVLKGNGFAMNAKIFVIDHDVRRVMKSTVMLHKDDIKFVEVDIKTALPILTTSLENFKITKQRKNKTIPVASHMHPLNIISRVNDHVPLDNTIICTGVGNHQQLAANFINVGKHRGFISSGAFGVMGYGLPAAIGAQLANPDSCVLLIDGDGSMSMTLTELSVAVQLKLPLKIIVINDSCLGMVYKHVGDGMIGMIDFAAAANSIDAIGMVVDDEIYIDIALEKMMRTHDKPFLIDYRASTGTSLPFYAKERLDQTIITANM